MEWVIDAPVENNPVCLSYSNGHDTAGNAETIFDVENRKRYIT